MSERRGVQSVNDKISWTSHHDTCYYLMLKWRIMCIAREIYEREAGISKKSTINLENSDERFANQCVHGLSFLACYKTWNENGK